MAEGHGMGVDGNGSRDSSMVPAMTEQHVMEAAAAKEWDRVREAMVGEVQHHVPLSVDAQVIILEEAMKDDAWGFIAELVEDGFNFGPDTLDKVLEVALENRDLEFLERVVLLCDNPYQFDGEVLIDIMRAFCNEDAWLPQATLMAESLPSNVDTDLLDERVYVPLVHRGTEDEESKLNILYILRTRFFSVTDDDDSDS